MPGRLLRCPIRGLLKTEEFARDGLTYSEEKRRIDCIRFLLEKGYPAGHFLIETTLLRFGHQGRNTFRTDLAVLDIPVSSLPSSPDQATILEHTRLVAEIKRDNTNAAQAKQTQVKPALSLLPFLQAVAIYWDDLEQRLFYRTLENNQFQIHETTVAVLPGWGQRLDTPALLRSNLTPTPSLLTLFQRIEDRLHTVMADKSRRFEVMLQLLLAKLYDEHSHPSASDPMTLQDFTDALVGDAEVVRIFNDLLQRAAQFYARYLPKPVPETFSLSGALLRTLSAILAPVSISASRKEVIQDFYMYFAKSLYKWDLAQYFTPSEVVDFIVALVNPRPGNQIKDPACGSGDFLISAFRYGQQFGADMTDAVWGADNSENAVQVSILNMVLNGDGKGNIRLEDSLVEVTRDTNAFQVMLCNPPFGVRIQERRFEVLRQFDLGHQWKATEPPVFFKMVDETLHAQETGILFAELCVRQAVPGGRVGIILPNGYLGNRSLRYLAFREWLLHHTRVVAVVAFPRFTFKKSGADVSASAVILEKRLEPLPHARASEDYPFYAGLLESVGWSVSDKKARRIFRRDPETGDLILNDRNEPVPDTDFDRVLRDLHASDVAAAFPWLTAGLAPPPPNARGWSVSIRDVLDRRDLSLDPKRWCQRHLAVRQHITSLPHFRIGDLVEVIPESPASWESREVFQYVELQNVSDGIVTPTSLRGWQLPKRARHQAEQGDLFVANVWGSVNKWFLAGGECKDWVVSNGFHRLRLKPAAQDTLPDLVAGLNTEAYRIQARAVATGSDGLAEINSDDLLDIVLPRVTDPEARNDLQTAINLLLAGRSTLANGVASLVKSGKIPTAPVPPRSTNWVQV